MDSLMKNKELVEQDEVKPTVATYTLPRSVSATEAMPSPTLPLTSKSLKQQTDDLMEEYYERMNEACNNLLSVRENALDFLDYVEQLRKQTDKTIIVSMSIQNFDKERLTAETLYDYFKASNSGMMYTFKLQYFKDRHSAIWNGIRTQLQSQADQLGAKLD
ncbi:TPR and ankyrin repeat-containing protein 1-like protein [Corchorus olitorius]|uniref:TPR and ankyrin repeat-containing protein 1-like protein n=1 Tax=Corchorus olitorius TaxID=93759 RepID=A0A1R3L0R3_9ROSI|nr:TPR and ankyrin repeat-containing protein 1-like protein [Corchorus olitorius]